MMLAIGYLHIFLHSSLIVSCDIFMQEYNARNLLLVSKYLAEKLVATASCLTRLQN